MSGTERMETNNGELPFPIGSACEAHASNSVVRRLKPLHPTGLKPPTPSPSAKARCKKMLRDTVRPR
jgi:hypothetical protein